MHAGTLKLQMYRLPWRGYSASETPSSIPVVAPRNRNRLQSKEYSSNDWTEGVLVRTYRHCTRHHCMSRISSESYPSALADSIQIRSGVSQSPDFRMICVFQQNTPILPSAKAHGHPAVSTSPPDVLQHTILLKDPCAAGNNANDAARPLKAGLSFQNLDLMAFICDGNSSSKTSHSWQEKFAVSNIQGLPIFVLLLHSKVFLAISLWACPEFPKAGLDGQTYLHQR